MRETHGRRLRLTEPARLEAQVDARIAPLPIDDAASFEPFLYGDHFWATTMQYVEFHGMEALRMPSGVTGAENISAETP